MKADAVYRCVCECKCVEELHYCPPPPKKKKNGGGGGGGGAETLVSLNLFEIIDPSQTDRQKHRQTDRHRHTHRDRNSGFTYSISSIHHFMPQKSVQCLRWRHFMSCHFLMLLFKTVA